MKTPNEVWRLVETIAICKGHALRYPMKKGAHPGNFVSLRCDNCAASFHAHLANMWYMSALTLIAYPCANEVDVADIIEYQRVSVTIEDALNG